MTATFENSDVSESNESNDNASIKDDLKVDKISADEKKEKKENNSKFRKFTDQFNIFSWKVFLELKIKFCYFHLLCTKICFLINPLFFRQSKRIAVRTN